MLSQNIHTLQVISKKLPADQLKSFVDLVQEGLVDPQSHSSSGACVVLNGVMKTRGAELLKEVITVNTLSQYYTGT